MPPPRCVRRVKPYSKLRQYRNVAFSNFNTNHKIMNLTSRRNALKTLAMGTGGILLSPQILRVSGLGKKDRLGIALVGLGYYSTDLLAPALQQTKNCYLAGIVTGTPAKAEA